MTARSALLQRILKFVYQNPLEREREANRRLRELNDMIAAQPDSLSHYVLRGELLAERGDSEGALQDFRRAVQIAEAVDLGATWGLLEQVLRDRALQGIERISRRN